ncbi:hypothetical protein [Paraburkholderia phenazinium]|uniref:Chemotaxis phosphatase CheX-like domain-containing protein n=1 Tax=Paraburkholderia phenazinium TaxID=60549 RepID=A0A1G8KF14_9BURK|nr:hypothetical protein [Paraburkholderia phenazinium]SDI41470.1 hypothetical protein SAMN05216466_12291 [Paraburkholderia phenazinium]
MISAHAKDSIERIVFRAARSRLTMDAGDVCEIVPAGAHGAHSLPDTNLVILTISGIAFRLLLILHFDEDERTHGYFVKEESERPFLEVFLEICNLCCGAVNQELLQYFPDLGMSTPYVLSARCMPYMEALKPEFMASYAVAINDSVRLGATICVCAHAPIDFVAEVSAVEDTSGELELF